MPLYWKFHMSVHYTLVDLKFQPILSIMAKLNKYTHRIWLILTKPEHKNARGVPRAFVFYCVLLCFNWGFVFCRQDILTYNF